MRRNLQLQSENLIPHNKIEEIFGIAPKIIAVRDSQQKLSEPSTQMFPRLFNSVARWEKIQISKGRRRYMRLFLFWVLINLRQASETKSNSTVGGSHFPLRCSLSSKKLTASITERS